MGGFQEGGFQIVESAAFSLRRDLLLQGNFYQNLTLRLLLRPRVWGQIYYCKNPPSENPPFNFPDLAFSVKKENDRKKKQGFSFPGKPLKSLGKKGKHPKKQGSPCKRKKARNSKKQGKEDQGVGHLGRVRVSVRHPIFRCPPLRCPPLGPPNPWQDPWAYHGKHSQQQQPVLRNLRDLVSCSTYQDLGE